ncbi:hypothetical protein PILCRDRAFT_526 [Piloderma croceum F 1598]|uniref:Uncharacterized protein n=1 Tax=Piloderma croceum (strain F 1598) TaxID=765440 RepID=A0A0C3BXM5_PILCF|nr:hypothetical protein PILCRDRAFT_526 [Piloderma croceum F 1598]
MIERWSRKASSNNSLLCLSDKYTVTAVCVALLASVSVNGLALSQIDTRTTLAVRDIHQFPNATWIENLAVRKDGQILVTVLSAPELYQVDPFHPNSPATLIYRIPEVTGLTGIVELRRDVFYVIAGNFSIATFKTTNGSYSVWEIDMRKSKVANGSVNPPPIVSKVTDIPERSFLDGMAVLSKSKGLVIGDAGAGAVSTLNVGTAKYSKTIDDPTMTPAGPLMLGINGMKIRGRFLYYTYQYWAGDLLPRPHQQFGWERSGSCEGYSKRDDFSFDQKGNAYVAQNVKDTVAKITSHGVVAIVACSLNSTLVAGATAINFGRMHADRSVVYVTTSGGIGSPEKIEGEKSGCDFHLNAGKRQVARLWTVFNPKFLHSLDTQTHFYSDIADIEE